MLQVSSNRPLCQRNAGAKESICGSEVDGVITPKEFGMIVGCNTEDAIGEGATKIYNLLTGADTKKASTAVTIISRITVKGVQSNSHTGFLENVYYVKELQQFNLFSISQICDKKNRVLFTDTDYLVLSKDFMLPDESTQDAESRLRKLMIPPLDTPTEENFSKRFLPVTESQEQRATSDAKDTEEL
ncbi:hypothetical protein Tco_1163797 [Tanacetum coccineum]